MVHNLYKQKLYPAQRGVVHARTPQEFMTRWMVAWRPDACIVDTHVRTVSDDNLRSHQGRAYHGQ